MGKINITGEIMHVHCLSKIMGEKEINEIFTLTDLAKISPVEMFPYLVQAIETESPKK